MSHLGFGNLPGEDTAHAFAPGVYVQHHLYRLLLIEIEEASQYLYHEIHRGKVIIQQKDLKKWRTSDFRLGNFHRQTATAALFVFGFVGHDFLGSSSLIRSIRRRGCRFFQRQPLSHTSR